MPLGRKITITDVQTKWAIRIEDLIKQLQKFDKDLYICPDASARELHVYKLLTNGGNTEWVAQIFFD